MQLSHHLQLTIAAVYELSWPSVQAYGTTALATMKLHHAVHHVGDQMATQGFPAQFQELWIERMVGYVKELVHGNANADPEITAVKVHLTKVAAARSR